ncbi:MULTISPECIES: endonuclease III [Lactobacillus]|uniref:Endonuclease III n=1 Tax=Lactobacillus xujianguonis TaxID=2495899 RepID=A0A437SXS3_9LACO|nr:MULTISPECIES: endonuclease III [Lactobacillus]RVU71733.1 endonuclease III [Lactobacillus xujianguonis]RVU77563.1 endonuclease III [Lactobacillus xujianguonis]
MVAEKLLSDQQAREVLERIDAMYPEAKSELHWDNNFHLLCAVLMSAQTTDKMVNRVMPKFMADYPTPAALAQAPIAEIEDHIKQIGLYKSKAKHLKETAQILTNKYHGKIPQDKKTLMTLPGVGEKTANVVLAEGFGVPAIAVDTHVSRISKKFHIVNAKATPHEVEKRLEELLPKDKWIHTHHAMIFFGRYTMPARAKDEDPYSYLPPKK